MSMFVRLQEATPSGKVHVGKGSGRKTPAQMDRVRAEGGLYSRARTVKSAYAAQLATHQDSYLLGAILDIMTDDILAPSPETGQVVTLFSRDKAINEHLKALQEALDIDRLLIEATSEMLVRGEYIPAVKTVSKGGKVRSFDIVDSLDQSSVVAFYDKPDSIAFFAYAAGTIMADIKKLEPSEAVHFLFSAKKIKMTGSVFAPKISMPAGLSVRIGQSIFQTSIEKMNTLAILDVLPLAHKLAALGTQTLMGVPVGADADPKDAFDTCRKYERILNQQVDFGHLRGKANITPEDVINMTRIKPMPIFDQRGDLRKMEVSKIDREVASLQDIDDTRRVICAAVGIPYEFVFGSQGGNKMENLRGFSRYVRKLRMAQAGLAFGLQQIAYTYLVAAGIKNLTRDSVQVTFENRLVNVEELDNLEFSDTVFSVLSNVGRTLRELKELGYPDKMDTGISTAIGKYLHTAGFPVADQKNPLKLGDEEEEGGGGGGGFR